MALITRIISGVGGTNAPQLFIYGAISCVGTYAEVHVVKLIR
jgi:hypothetical protein